MSAKNWSCGKRAAGSAGVGPRRRFRGPIYRSPASQFKPGWMLRVCSAEGEAATIAAHGLGWMMLGLLLLLGGKETLSAQSGPDPFEAMQALGAHRFDDLPDGGRIEIQRDSGDTAGIRVVREHLAGIARAFAAGDFGTPATVHAEPVPGTAVMKERRGHIRYDFRPVPLGGEIRIRTRDPAALKAVHSFLAYQRRDHGAAGSQHTH
jgi:hypothetical protein